MNSMSEIAAEARKAARKTRDERNTSVLEDGRVSFKDSTGAITIYPSREAFECARRSTYSMPKGLMDEFEKLGRSMDARESRE